MSQMIALVSLLLVTYTLAVPLNRTPGNILANNRPVPPGQTLSNRISDAIIPNIINFNNRLYTAAGNIPSYMPTGTGALGYAIAAPIRLGTMLGNAFAPTIVRSVVSAPINAVSSRFPSLIGTQSQAPASPFAARRIGARPPRPTLPIRGSTINQAAMSALTTTVTRAVQRFLGF